MQYLIPIGAALLLAACGGPEREAAGTGESAAEGETVFEPMTETLDRAKAVEEVGKERKQAMDEALERAEGGSPE